MRTLLLTFSLFSVLFLPAQGNLLSPEAQISILTIGPGKNLNDAFGHSAFRVKDPTQKLDIAYNYGVYDFTAKHFYLKFAQGKLNYKIESDPAGAFINYYMRQDRSVKEQVLNLNQGEKQALFDYLLENMRPENQFYLYDFFFDNCATKIKDVLEEAIGDIDFKSPETFEAKTFRELIYENVNKNSWGSLGIDVALGSVIDQKATYEQHMFLPEYIHDFFAEAKIISSRKLVNSSEIHYTKQKEYDTINFLISPLFIFILLGLVIVLITYKDHKKGIRTIWLDVFLFGLTGLIGIGVLLLWFATDHTATANNYNLLWAFALNLFMIGQIAKHQFTKWFVKYLKLLVILLCLLSLHWLIGVQIYAISLIPLILALAVRYVYLVRC
jgi:hypothetical protein